MSMRPTKRDPFQQRKDVVAEFALVPGHEDLDAYSRSRRCAPTRARSRSTGSNGDSTRKRRGRPRQVRQMRFDVGPRHARQSRVARRRLQRHVDQAALFLLARDPLPPPRGWRHGPRNRRSSAPSPHPAVRAPRCTPSRASAPRDGRASRKLARNASVRPDRRSSRSRRAPAPRVRRCARDIRAPPWPVPSPTTARCARPDARNRAPATRRAPRCDRARSSARGRRRSARATRRYATALCAKR